MRQQHRLGGGDVVNGDQMIGDEFHPAAIAVGAEIGALPGEIGKQIGASGNGGTVAAGVDHEIAIFGLRAGSTQRTIQRNVAGLLQDGFEAKLVGDGERGEFDHDPRRRGGTGDTLRDILDRCGTGQAGHDDGRAAARPGRHHRRS